MRFEADDTSLVRDVMTSELITVKEGADRSECRKLLHRHRIEKLVVVSDDGDFKGLMTIRDIEGAERHPNASTDVQGRLLVAAAVGTGRDCESRIESLVGAGVDVLVVDTTGIVKVCSMRFQRFASNIQTSRLSLVMLRRLRSWGTYRSRRGCRKIGIGPGSFATRVVAGVGVPQFSFSM